MSRPLILSLRVVVALLTLFATLFASQPLIGQLRGPKNCTTQISGPNLSPAPGEVRFGAIGDTGTGKAPQKTLADRMLEFENTKASFGALLFLGDNVYKRGNPKHFPKKLYEPYEKFPGQGVEIRGVIGNHDALNDSGVKEQMAYFRKGLTSGGGETYYSFSLPSGGKPLVEIFALDSNLLVSKPGRESYTVNTREEQYQWLERSLSTSNATWKVIILHHPFYSSAKGHGVKKVDESGNETKIPGEMERLRTIEGLLTKYSVKLVLAGHDHDFERILPRTQVGTVHFVSGAGAKLRTKDLNRKRLPNYHGCGNSQVLSFMLFSATSDQLRYWAINENMIVFDSGIIK